MERLFLSLLQSRILWAPDKLLAEILIFEMFVKISYKYILIYLAIEIIQIM